jgi:hypothetical protein
MDESVMRAMARWPDVPAVFGWLDLDRRGRWLLKGESIPNRAALAFIARNYAVDVYGRWFFQNGPQRVFVTLELTPWIIRLQDDGGLSTHTQAGVPCVHAVFMDERGDVVLDTALGAGLLDDRDLELFSERIRDASGRRISDDALIEAVDALGAAACVGLQAELGGTLVPLRFLARENVPSRLGFVRNPQPREDDG